MTAAGPGDSDRDGPGTRAEPPQAAPTSGPGQTRPGPGPDSPEGSRSRRSAGTVSSIMIRVIQVHRRVRPGRVTVTVTPAGPGPVTGPDSGKELTPESRSLVTVSNFKLERSRSRFNLKFKLP